MLQIEPLLEKKVKNKKKKTFLKKKTFSVGA